MPPRLEGLRRLPGFNSKSFSGVFKQWLARQSVFRRVVMGVAGYLVLALTAYAIFGGNACAVMVDGKTVAVAANEKTAKQALGEVLKQKSGEIGGPVKVAGKISYKSIKVQPEELLERETLQARLNETLIFNTECTAIVINGEEKIFIKEKEDAETLLAWLQTLYPAEEGEHPAIKENVELVETSSAIDNVLDLETAKKTVLLGTNKIEQYVIKDGDTLWDIARAVNIDVDQIAMANPDIDIDHISIGQSLYLSKAAPLLTVMATRQLTVNEEIPYEVEVKKDDQLLLGEKKVLTRGEPGERTVTYLITRENGFETGRQVLEQKIVREATTEVVAMGSVTMLASRGGGRLSWPCSGGITSPFGMRWGRMHEGIDIGAGYGCKVAAAAGGTVIFTGWDGGYGKSVQISHGGGLVTHYAHLSSIEVSNGETVERGELIGMVGSTGSSDGPHLHFEVLVGGQPRNPVNYLP
ncbi:MAG TPA: peptidase M23 [Pelotomaculum sp.]|nr:peptidase M23 [Pelotomaculum sp.]